jgi:polar amino acid transport system substrate-binding protein
MRGHPAACQNRSPRSCRREHDLAVTRRGFLAGATSLALLSSAGQARAAAASIRVVLAESYAPFSFPNEDKTMTGIFVRGMSAVAKKLDWQISYAGYPWARAQQVLRDGGADAYCTVPTDDRRAYAVFCPTPLFQIVTAAHFLPENPRAEEIRAIRSMDDLRKFKVADFLGNGWAEARFKGWEKYEWVPNMETVVRMLMAGRVDLAIEAPELINFYKKKLGVAEKTEQVALDFVPGVSQPFTFGLRKSVEGSEQRIAEFEAAQQVLIADGSLAKVRAEFTAG